METEELFDALPETELVVEEKTEDATGEVKTEAADEAKPEETKEVEELSPDPKSETQVPISAMHGERDRRKNAETERDELKAQLDKSNETPPTSVFEDEGKFREEVQSSVNSALLNQSLNQSEFFAAKELGRDVLDQKIVVFKDLAKDNPQLREQFAGAVSPYHELVDIVDRHDELDKMKDLDGYKARLKAEAKAEVKVELEAEEKEKKDLRASIPGSLVGEASAGGLNSGDHEALASAEDTYNN